jgi:hypothetical protein
MRIALSRCLRGFCADARQRLGGHISSIASDLPRFLRPEPVSYQRAEEPSNEEHQIAQGIWEQDPGRLRKVQPNGDYQRSCRVTLLSTMSPK